MTDAPTITQALDTWSAWHADSSPLGATGDFALDMRLADAFRALLYRQDLGARLDWLRRETSRPRRRASDDLYHAELITWWLDLYESEKAPAIEARTIQRRTACATF